MHGNRFIGVILIVLGILFSFDRLHIIHLSMELMWPLFVLVPGLSFHVAFFGSRKHNAGLLVPGGILTTYGLLFFVNNLFGWQLMEVLWPVFILGVALGLFELYLFGPRQPGLLIPVGILTTIGGIFLAINLFHLGGGIVTGLVFICAGLIVVFFNGGKKGI